MVWRRKLKLTKLRNTLALLLRYQTNDMYNGHVARAFTIVKISQASNDNNFFMKINLKHVLVAINTMLHRGSRTQKLDYEFS